MTEVMGVRFKSVGKIYYFDPDGKEAVKGQKVIVETARGTECGEVVTPNHMVEDEECTQPLKKVLRIATREDLAQLARNREREANAYQVCEEKIRKHKLDMKLIAVEYTFDNNKILFYFTAEGRVDFRELVKDLASVLKTRIELRQIGVRDEAKMLGGIGICGRPFCCATFLGEFQPVSIKMAKEQGLSLNPAKISGTCGRLMCCLKYEQNAYEDLIRTTPRQGTPVQTPEGRGVVTEVNLMTGMLKVVLDSTVNHSTTPFHKNDVRSLRGEQRPPRQEQAASPAPQKQQEGEGAVQPPQQPQGQQRAQGGDRNRGGRRRNDRNRRRRDGNRPNRTGDKPAKSE